jgi:pectinesterase
MNQMLPPIRKSSGSARRPELTATEAAAFTPAHYLARGGLLADPDPAWQPEPVQSTLADFVVGHGGNYATVQAAINAALRSGRETRQFIRILPGCYHGAVYIPADAPPLTLYGAGGFAQEVKLELCLDARMSPADFVREVNPDGQFNPGDPAWAMFKASASLPGKIIDTPSAAVVWSQARDLQLKNLSITNTLLDTVDGGTHQAVALRCDGDRTQLENVRLISRQDTFFCNAGELPTAGNKLGAYPCDRIARVHARDCYFEGDTDYIFGRATAVFEACEFHSVSSRRQLPTIVFAPNTLPEVTLGFLALHCRFTSDAWLQRKGTSFLGRSWDQGYGPTDYRPGFSSNGQLVIRDSQLDTSINPLNPWDKAATTLRPYSGNDSAHRNLDDPAFNRLWEFNNQGPGAAQS